MNIDNRLRELHDIAARIDAARDQLKSGNGGGGGNGMDNRVSRLEGQFDKLRDDNAALNVALATLIERVAHLPSKEFIFKTALGMVIALTAVVTFADKLQAMVK